MQNKFSVPIRMQNKFSVPVRMQNKFSVPVRMQNKFSVPVRMQNKLPFLHQIYSVLKVELYTCKQAHSWRARQMHNRS